MVLLELVGVEVVDPPIGPTPLSPLVVDVETELLAPELKDLDEVDLDVKVEEWLV